VKIAIISLLLSSMFLLSARGLAQQSSDDPVAAQAQAAAQPRQPLHSTKPARRTAVFQSTLSAVKEFCGKNKDNAACKSYSTEYNAASKLVEKSPELQAYIETGLLPDKPIKFGSLPAPDKSDADTSDKSWMIEALAHQQQEAADTPAAPRPNATADGVRNVEVAIDTLAGKNSKELGEQFAGDIRFPGRDQWEQNLYKEKERLVAATRVWIAVMRSNGAASGSVHEALVNMKAAQIGYSEVQEEGIGKAADWEKKTGR
jgi:hypothetical protein